MNDTKSASVAFEDTYQHESVALYAGDDGDDLIILATRFCEDNKIPDLSSQEAMFEFCIYLADMRGILPIPEDLYFGMDGDDGDNSALGHHVILLVSGQEKFKQNLHE